jgi:small subunit ribosomal protein S3
MGQKTHPKGLRIGISETWESKWFTQRDFADFIAEDYTIRRYIKKRFEKGAVSKVEIERTPKEIIITIHTGRPGVVIGRKGVVIDRLKDELQLILSRSVTINVQEIREVDLDAALVAENIVRQIEQRVSYKRAMKRAIASVMRVGAKGVKVACKGRLMGVEIARKEWYKEGKIPLHTLKAKVDYAMRTAQTKFGTIGVKVWIYTEEGD